MSYNDESLNLQIRNNSKDDALVRLVFPKLTKQLSRDRSVGILLAAIACYATDGIEKSTYEMIARRAQVSRPLLFKYFEDYDDIFDRAASLIRHHFQSYTSSAVENEHQPSRKLATYLTSAFDWMELHPDFARGHLLFLQRCSRSQRERDLNSEVAENARQRIATLIQSSSAAQRFEVKDLDKTARRIHSILSAGMVTLLTENIENEMAVREDMLSFCQSLIRVRPVAKG